MKETYTTSIVVLFTVAVIILAGCSTEEEVQPVDCALSSFDITLQSSIDATSCSASDGSIAVVTIDGKGPFTFTLGSTTNQTGSFQGLPAGTYLISVTDANTCERTLEVTLKAAGSTLSLTTSSTKNTGCTTANGTITAMVQGGVSPYEYSLDNGDFNSSSSFTGLKAGNYAISVKDKDGCVFVKNTTVEKGDTGVSFASQIQPIIATKCAISGCHNGDSGASRNWTVFSNVQANAASIKTRTGDRSMPQTGSLTQAQIDLIACWVDDGAKNN
ncbi:MAG TPA: hypothetical protein DIS90_14160 [Cytophagales bacterium]|nr:hypothetical protein [Cytophagales bacterium]